MTSGLRIGGAERALARLLRHLRGDDIRAVVISLTERGPVGDEIAALGVPVRALQMRGPLDIPRAVAQLIRAFRQDRPDVVQTWMPAADLLGGVAARLAGVEAVVWGIRLTALELFGERRWTHLAVRAAAWLSRVVPTRIVYNAYSGRAAHERFGYSRTRGMVIPNGFPLASVVAEDGRRLRQQLGIPADVLLVGRVARFHPVKDYGTFVKAAGVVCAQLDHVHFAACGDGIAETNEVLQGLVSSQPSLKGRFHTIGTLHDLRPFYAALDVACSSSLGEGFPNVVGEAMAAGVAGVVTDVGDSAFLLGDSGRVVSPGDAAALADALIEVLKMTPEDRRRMGARGRRRIAEEFTLPVMSSQYAALYRRVVGRA